MTDTDNILPQHETPRNTNDDGDTDTITPNKTPIFTANESGTKTQDSSHGFAGNTCISDLYYLSFKKFKGIKFNRAFGQVRNICTQIGFNECVGRVHMSLASDFGWPTVSIELCTNEWNRQQADTTLCANQQNSQKSFSGSIYCGNGLVRYMYVEGMHGARKIGQLIMTRTILNLPEFNGPCYQMECALQRCESADQLREVIFLDEDDNPETNPKQ
ncbi:unnamed protein product [Absidia cylindrospora]